MGNNVQELLEMLYNMVQNAWAVPLGAGKCVIERDKALDLLDELKAQFPSELAEARRLTAARNEYIANTKRDAEAIKKAANDRASQLVEQEEIVRAARQRSANLVNDAMSKSNELRRVANEYADDTLRRTEEAISAALNEVRQSRSRFQAISQTIVRQSEEAAVEAVEEETGF